MSAQEISNLITQQLTLANQELKTSLDQKCANFAGEVDTMRGQLSGEIATLRMQIEDIVKKADERYSSNMETINNNAAGVRRELDNVATNVRRIDNESVSVSSKFAELQNATALHRTELEKGIITIKEDIDKKIEEIQNSLSTAVVSNSPDAGRSGGGNAKTFSLDTDKRLLSFSTISGNEDIIMIHEWWTKLFVKMESCIPMSKPYLEAVVVSPTEVTNLEIDSRDDRMLGAPPQQGIVLLAHRSDNEQSMVFDKEHRFEKRIGSHAHVVQSDHYAWPGSASGRAQVLEQPHA